MEPRAVSRAALSRQRRWLRAFYMGVQHEKAAAEITRACLARHELPASDAFDHDAVDSMAQQQPFTEMHAYATTMGLLPDRCLEAISMYCGMSESSRSSSSACETRGLHHASSALPVTCSFFRDGLTEMRHQSQDISKLLRHRRAWKPNKYSFVFPPRAARDCEIEAGNRPPVKAGSLVVGDATHSRHDGSSTSATILDVVMPTAGEELTDVRSREVFGLMQSKEYEDDATQPQCAEVAAMAGAAESKKEERLGMATEEHGYDGAVCKISSCHETIPGCSSSDSTSSLPATSCATQAGTRPLVIAGRRCIDELYEELITLVKDSSVEIEAAAQLIQRRRDLLHAYEQAMPLLCQDIHATCIENGLMAYAAGRRYDWPEVPCDFAPQVIRFRAGVRPLANYAYYGAFGSRKCSLRMNAHML